MGIQDLTDHCVDYRHPSLLPTARESRLFSHDQYTADAQSYANIIAFLRSNPSRETGAGGGGAGDNNNRMTTNEATSINQSNNPTRNYDNRNNSNNHHHNERKQNVSSSSSSSAFDSVPLFGLEELSEADIDSDSLIDGFFHSHYILPSSPLVLSHPLASSSTNSNNNSNNNNNRHMNTSGPVRHHRTRVPAGFSLVPDDYYGNNSNNNNNNPINTSTITSTLIEEELPVEFLQPPSSSPQPVIDYQTTLTLLDGIQFAAI